MMGTAPNGIETTMHVLKTTVLAEGFFLLEAPRWHAGALWMSDIIGCKVYCVDLEGRVKTVADVPGRPSGLGFMPDGTPLVVSMRDRRLLRLEDSGPVCHADLKGLAVGELNDMVVDRHGRAYIDSFDFHERVPRCFTDARVILVTAEGESRIVAEDFAFPNGSLITGDHQLIVSETFGNRLVAFQIADDGSLFQRRSFADLEQVSPDGICLDAAGAIWVAAARQSLFVRVFEGGRISHWVHTPGHQAVACQLGGPDGRTLFCLTLAQDFVEDGQDGVATSRVEITRVDVPRAGSP